MVTCENVGESCHSVFKLLSPGGKERNHENLSIKEQTNFVKQEFFLLDDSALSAKQETHAFCGILRASSLTAIFKPTRISLLSQMNAVYIISSCLRSVLISSFPTILGFPKWSVLHIFNIILSYSSRFFKLSLPIFPH